MSVMTLRFESFGNVRDTLGNLSLCEGRHKVNVCKALGVSEENLLSAIDDFVAHCYIFNDCAHRMRYHEQDAPTETGINCIKAVGKVVSRTQLFKTLNCIAYNSDIRDYMDAEEYEHSALRTSFEPWWQRLNNLVAAVAESIAWEQADKEHCEWG